MNNKEIIIRDMLHAIDLTIERHQAVLDGKYKGYSEAVSDMTPKNWSQHCPLCQYGDEILNDPSESPCGACPWKIYENKLCPSPHQGDKESILRLNRWKRELLK